MGSLILHSGEERGPLPRFTRGRIRDPRRCDIPGRGRAERTWRIRHGPGRWPIASRRSSRKRLDKGLRDPRLGFVTITDVRVTGDLQHASIFYTVYGTDEERRDSALALKSATGMLRTEVGRNITARLTPSLEFIPDAIPENAEHIEALLREARDARRRDDVLAATAEYAGDADPYVKPRELDEDATIRRDRRDDDGSDVVDDADAARSLLALGHDAIAAGSRVRQAQPVALGHREPVGDERRRSRGRAARHPPRRARAPSARRGGAPPAARA